jgi:hypothetical protein
MLSPMVDPAAKASRMPQRYHRAVDGRIRRREHLVMRYLWLLALTACVVPRAERPRSANAFDAVAAGALTAKELADGTPEEKVLAWNLLVVGDRATYRVCSEPDACTYRAVDVPAAALVATETIGRARPTRDDGRAGDEVDVVRLTLRREKSTTRGGAGSDPRGIVIR